MSGEKKIDSGTSTEQAKARMGAMAKEAVELAASELAQVAVEQFQQNVKALADDENLDPVQLLIAGSGFTSASSGNSNLVLALPSSSGGVMALSTSGGELSGSDLRFASQVLASYADVVESPNLL